MGERPPLKRQTIIKHAADHDFRLREQDDLCARPAERVAS